MKPHKPTIRKYRQLIRQCQEAIAIDHDSPLGRDIPAKYLDGRGEETTLAHIDRKASKTLAKQRKAERNAKREANKAANIEAYTAQVEQGPINEDGVFDGELVSNILNGNEAIANQMLFLNLMGIELTDD